TAFGELIAHTGTDPQPYAFAGEPYDPNTGLQYHRARWMDARGGRFLGMDPLRGNSSDPASLHRYTYVASEPVGRIDPSGLSFSLESLVVTGIIGSLVGGLVGGIRGGVDGAVGGAVAGLFLGPASFGIAAGVGGVIAAVFGVSTATGVGIASAAMGVFSLNAGINEYRNARTVREEVAAAITIALTLAPLMLAAGASGSGALVRVRYKAGWSPEQRALANSKVSALNQAAQTGEAARANPIRSGTSAAARYRAACGPVPQGCDVDHVLDLQLGGEDVLTNMSPLDLSVNRSLGSQIHRQIKDLPLGTRITGVIIED
ncbi:MAG: RHS repeat-associated core domain-containing protein, partial [Vicinamibacteria bacterium]|nr:RHS repeat-associated core domain-containing protein [Vicinamibacteria bacterium]